jgi:hypothetical protein
MNDEQVAAWRLRLVASLLKLRDGHVSFIDGIRDVLALANEPHVRDKEFDLFVSIESETDHVPPERARASCTNEWLARCDLESSQVESFYRAAVNAKVASLLSELAATGSMR